MIAGGLAARLAWFAATRFTFEDAFITFQFAKRLAGGEGFVYNPGEPIYGTTTPLFTLLLAGWLKLFPGHPVAGATLLDLAASAGALVLTWAALTRLGVTPRARLCAIGALAICDKLWLHDTGGMETPLLLCLMAASGYACLRGWPVRAGITGGLLLWTRLDTVTWLAALFAAAIWTTRRVPWRAIVSAAATYAPWLVFAVATFNSPIPHTIIAKWFSYSAFHPPPWRTSAAALLAQISPSNALGVPAVWPLTLSAVLLAAAALGLSRIRSHPALVALPVFASIEALHIVATGATFETRYCVPMLAVLLVLAGLEIDRAWDFLGARPLRRRACALAAGGLAATFVASAYVSARRYRDVQVYRHERGLTAVGNWLHAHTPRDASVFLEPLGYAGYFADRHMIDGVGLISPQVVELKKQGLYDESQLVSHIRPDFFVCHCDAAALGPKADQEDRVLSLYTLQVTINPFGFDARRPQKRNLAWVSCYEIWARDGTRTSGPTAASPRAGS